jgi:CHAT domain-containing protein
LPVDFPVIKMLIRFALAILVLAIIIVAQTSVAAQIRNEEDMLSALVSLPNDKGTSASTLFLDHHDLVSRSLFDKLMSQAEQLSSSDAPKALHIYELAKEVAEQLGDKKLVAYGSYKIGLLHFRQGDVPQAKLNYLKSKESLEQTGQPSDLVLLLGSLGNVCLYQDSLSEAKQYSQRGIALANELHADDKPLIGPIEYGVALSWGNVGDIAKGEGHYDEALAYYQKALESLKALSAVRPQYTADVADSLADIGRLYRVMGDHQRALKYFNEAAAIAKDLQAPDKLASVFNSIGVLYIEQNDYSKASDFISRSLAIYRTTGDRFEIARLLLNQGVINQRQGKYEDAIQCFRESTENASAVDATDLIIAAQEGMGAVYQEQGKGVSALEWLGKALSTAQKVGDKTRQAELLWRSGEAYYLTGDLSKAIGSAGSAAELAGELRLPIISYLALTAKGKYCIAQKNYDLAFQTLSRAIEQIEAMRGQVAGAQQERQEFFENKVESYSLLVDLFVKQNKSVEALLYAEKAKARVLLDVLRDGKPDLSRGLLPDETETLKRLNLNVSDLNERIRKEQANTRLDAALVDQLYAKLDHARVEYASFQDNLYASHPEFNVRRGRTSVLTSEEMNGLTSDGKTAYLEYVVTKERVYLFAMTGGGSDGSTQVNVYPISAKPDELVLKVNQFHEILAEHKAGYANAGSELYSLLIAPAEQQLGNVDTLCIVPDSFLWNVPFQALMTSSDHFLIEAHAIYYAPSLSVLREMNQKSATSEKTSSSLIAFGNPVIGIDEQRNTDVCPLPEAEQEVTSIAKSFNQKTSKILIGREATEKTFKALAPTYSVVHLATHGVIDNKQPLYSHLLLTKTEGDPENDGRLEARQIMDMNLHADLAVLSACETANGKIAPGEGVMGLSWAFFVAGTRSMLVSQWKINSASTSELMHNFYNNLWSKASVESRSKPRALREAALSMIQNGEFRHPFFWAGFVMIGN